MLLRRHTEGQTQDSSSQTQDRVTGQTQDRVTPQTQDRPAADHVTSREAHVTSTNNSDFKSPTAVKTQYVNNNTFSASESKHSLHAHVVNPVSPTAISRTEFSARMSKSPTTEFSARMSTSPQTNGTYNGPAHVQSLWDSARISPHANDAHSGDMSVQLLWDSARISPHADGAYSGDMSVHSLLDSARLTPHNNGTYTGDVEVHSLMDHARVSAYTTNGSNTVPAYTNGSSTAGVRVHSNWDQASSTAADIFVRPTVFSPTHSTNSLGQGAADQRTPESMHARTDHSVGSLETPSRTQNQAKDTLQPPHAPSISVYGDVLRTAYSVRSPATPPQTQNQNDNDGWDAVQRNLRALRVMWLSGSAGSGMLNGAENHQEHTERLHSDSDSDSALLLPPLDTAGDAVPCQDAHEEPESVLRVDSDSERGIVSQNSALAVLLESDVTVTTGVREHRGHTSSSLHIEEIGAIRDYMRAINLSLNQGSGDVSTGSFVDSARASRRSMHMHMDNSTSTSPTERHTVKDMYTHTKDMHNSASPPDSDTVTHHPYSPHTNSKAMHMENAVLRAASLLWLNSSPENDQNSTTNALLSGGLPSASSLLSKLSSEYGMDAHARHTSISAQTTHAKSRNSPYPRETEENQTSKSAHVKPKNAQRYRKTRRYLSSSSSSSSSLSDSDVCAPMHANGTHTTLDLRDILTMMMMRSNPNISKQSPQPSSRKSPDQPYLGTPGRLSTTDAVVSLHTSVQSPLHVSDADARVHGNKNGQSGSHSGGRIRQQQLLSGSMRSTDVERSSRVKSQRDARVNDDDESDGDDGLRIRQQQLLYGSMRSTDVEARLDARMNHDESDGDDGLRIRQHQLLSVSRRGGDGDGDASVRRGNGEVKADVRGRLIRDGMSTCVSYQDASQVRVCVRVYVCVCCFGCVCVCVCVCARAID
jgi:hypothetical protein